jgi:hypothetical protein
MGMREWSGCEQTLYGYEDVIVLNCSAVENEYWEYVDTQGTKQTHMGVNQHCGQR